MEPESKITVARSSPGDIQQRQVIVKLDGERIASLLFGREVTRTIEPGEHTLRVDNTWQKKTIDFRVEPGEEAKFQVINKTGRFTWYLVAALGAGPMYVSIVREQ